MQSGDIETNPGPDNIHELSILHLNIRSIRNKLDFIRDSFSDFDILCFSETHLDANVSTDTLFLSNFYSTPYRKDRTNHGGGVLAYINSNLLHVRRPDLEIFCNESIWIEVKVKNESFLIGLFYSPTTADALFFNSLNLNIEKALELSKNLIIVGDLNEDLLNPNFHNLKDVLLINSLTNVITAPTRQQAILDPVIIPEDFPFLDSGTLDIPNTISDHKATYITLPFQYDTEGAFNRVIFLYKKANFTLLKQKLSNYDWECLREETIDEACSKFNDTFLDFVKSCIPSKNVLIRPNDKPWYDSEIRKISRKRDRLKQKFNNSGNLNVLAQYKHFRNKVNNLKRHAKEQFYNNLEMSISDFHSNDKKQFWKVVRHFVKSNNTSASIPPLNSFPVTGQNDYCFSSEEKAELLNKFFTSISTVDDGNVALPDFEYKCQNRLSSITCTPHEVASLIGVLNPNKATGP
ncbi:MAG: endonuclease/exonuclease/phosphatase family protein, partial [gamma proteobacterium symbiont of Bathyaustriella thionipta]|nr:endonuclease/exonuclease/phosphatase family protein [gamma proteobacterium symbiont of Bathyaustriella thionipta]